jgi:hypothetical protein
MVTVEVPKLGYMEASLSFFIVIAFVSISSLYPYKGLENLNKSDMMKAIVIRVPSYTFTFIGIYYVAIIPFI